MSAALSLPESSLRLEPLDLLSKHANFVRSSWVGTTLDYRPALIVEDEHKKPHVWRMDAKTYWTEMSEWIDALLERPTTTTLIAHANDADGLAYGWVCWSRSDGRKTRLHMVYVIPRFRRLGIGARMLGEVPRDLPIETTTHTPKGKHVRKALGLPVMADDWSPIAMWRM